MIRLGHGWTETHEFSHCVELFHFFSVGLVPTAGVSLLRVRQRLGKYRIERCITNGPLAAVYQAFDSIHGIRVALKVPHPAAMDECFLADFKREARLAPTLEHPNILPIRDA